MGSARRNGILEAGSKAPDFKLRNLSGGETSLEELLPNAPLLLAFFKVTCPVCQLTFPFLDRVYRERTSASMEIYGISQDEADWTRDFNERFGVTFPVLLDTSKNHYAASSAYGLTTVPSLFLIERDGTISWSLEGFSKREIQALAAKAGVNPFRADENVPEWKAG
jgi:peroxiredoxin